jgi:hypothetical protein
LQKREARVHGSATKKKWKHTVIQKYFFLEILINVKAGRVNWGARKVYHGRRVGQALSNATYILSVSVALSPPYPALAVQTSRYGSPSIYLTKTLTQSFSAQYC